jgi:hypothetical protein
MDKKLNLDGVGCGWERYMYRTVLTGVSVHYGYCWWISSDHRAMRALSRLGATLCLLRVPRFSSTLVYFPVVSVGAGAR